MNSRGSPVDIEDGDWRASLAVVNGARMDTHAVDIGELRDARPLVVDGIADLPVLDGDSIWAVGEDVVSAMCAPIHLRAGLNWTKRFHALLSTLKSIEVHGIRKVKFYLFTK